MRYMEQEAYHGQCRSVYSAMTYKLSKLPQNDLVLGLWSEIIRRFVALCMQSYRSRRGDV